VSKPTITTLNQWAMEAEGVDKATFADMRSSLLLIAGEHYARANDRFYDRVRTSKDLSQDVKIRLTKNHIGRITKTYVNNIMTYAPGVKAAPHNEAESGDRKSAELCNAVWQDAKKKLDYDDQVSSWADDFVGISEVWTECYFDPQGGALVGYEQALDPETEAPIFEKMMQEQPTFDPATLSMVMQQVEVDDETKPVPDKLKPVFAGAIKFKEVHGFNAFRAPECKNLKHSPWYAIREMVPVPQLKQMFPGEDKEKMITETADRTFLVFDNVQGGYRKSDKNECLIRKWYFRPSYEYPEGYYFITTETGILDEGVLPGGLFPLEMEVFDRIQTSARGRGIVKQLRPYQIEINRCASKIAEHQMTLGDDKLIMFNGSKLTSGGQVPGVRGVNVQGAQAPTILAGRSGSQYLEYMQSQITEMYQVAMMQEDSAAAPNGQIEPYALLFKSASQKKIFKRHIKRFEGFLQRTCRLYLKMAKLYLSEDTVVLAIGSKERINISEFKNTRDLDVEINVEALSDDVETLMGKQLTMNHLMQYAGQQLSREDIGMIIKNMPYADAKDAFSDLTMNSTIARNLILALDRGEMPQVNPEEPQTYIVSRLSFRMLESDFANLHPHIQKNYSMQKGERLELAEELRQRTLRDNAGLIPASGALIDAGAWIPSPSDEDPSKTKRLRLPQDSVYWLYQKLQDQGFMQAELNKMTPETQGQMPGPPQQQQQPPVGEQG